MKRNLRPALVIFAVVAHLAAPVAAHAKVSLAAQPGDYCSATRGAGAAPSGQGSPRPVGEHHCAHAPCCASGAPDFAALPPVPLASSIAFEPVRAPATRPAAAIHVAVAAAQPRGPPLAA